MSAHPAPPVLSILDMPLPGTKKAPKKFKGDYRYIRDFLDHYERLLNQCHITNNDEKCAAIRQYCSSAVKETIEGLADYQTPDWTRLKTALLKLYDSERNDQRYSERDLMSFLRISRDTTITSMKQFRNYERSFQRIAGWLKGKGKLTEPEMDKYFWKGLPKKLRERIELRMTISDATLDLTKPFPITKIVSAAEALLLRDRFDVDESDYEQDVDWAEVASDSDSNSDNDDEYSRTRRRTKSKDDMKDRKIIHGEKARKIQKSLEKEEVKAQEQDEMDVLIKQLGQISVKDPRYGLLYYKAITKDARLEKILHPPQINSTPVKSPKPLNGRGPFRCFGCGEEDHGIDNCPPLNELTNQGIVKRDMNNRFCMQDGTRIQRAVGETIVQAAQRQKTSNTSSKSQSAHFIMSSESVVKSAPAYEYVEDASDNEEIYAAQGQPRMAKEKRKEHFDGVSLPSLKQVLAKDKRQSETNPSQNKSISQPRVVKKISDPKPVDVHETTFNPENDNDIIEDETEPRTKITRKPIIAHASAISKEVDPHVILNRALNAPLTMSVGEILGISKDLSTLMQNVTKYKRPITNSEEPSVPKKTTNFADSVLLAQVPGVLIKIMMECDGNSISAIIDTGSTLNIMHQRIYEKLQRPINKTATPMMNDANGGVRQMTGLVQNVPLLCGSVATRADIFVAEHVPFDLLLGRPWQRGNYVSIEERADGTYIIFKDPEHEGVFHELLGVPEPVQARRAYLGWKTPEDALPIDTDLFQATTLMATVTQPSLQVHPSWDISDDVWKDSDKRLGEKCDARTCHGSIGGIRPSAEYLHEVLFDDAYDENNTVTYQVCGHCHSICKKRSQGGKLIRAVSLQDIQEDSESCPSLLTPITEETLEQYGPLDYLMFPHKPLVALNVSVLGISCRQSEQEAVPSRHNDSFEESINNAMSHSNSAMSYSNNPVLHSKLDESVKNAMHNDITKNPVQDSNPEGSTLSRQYKYDPKLHVQSQVPVMENQSQELINFSNWLTSYVLNAHSHAHTPTHSPIYSPAQSPPPSKSANNSQVKKYFADLAEAINESFAEERKREEEEKRMKKKKKKRSYRKFSRKDSFGTITPKGSIKGKNDDDLIDLEREYLILDSEDLKEVKIEDYEWMDRIEQSFLDDFH